MSEVKQNKSVGFLGLLQIALIVLKLCKVIDWKWIYVLLPAITAVVISVGALIAILMVHNKK